MPLFKPSKILDELITAMASRQPATVPSKSFARLPTVATVAADRTMHKVFVGSSLSHGFEAPKRSG